ncbi:MAG: hypothetical protein PW792_01330 [Acidobacteriaceae bacterium]|nr:hypothetical protein [Acidobacteriaceae bacterium]
MRRGLAAITLFAASTVCAQVPEANPARPTVTNPATLPPVGYLQFEQGYNGALRSPETDTQYSVVQTIRLAVESHLMLQMASQPFARSLVDGQPTRDAGDVLLGATVVLFSPHESEEDRAAEAKDRHLHSYVKAAVPTVSLSYQGRVYQGSAPDLDMGSMRQGLTLLASGHSPIIDAHYDSNLVVNEQVDDNGVRRAQVGETISFDRPVISQSVQFSGELYHFTQPLVHADPTGRPVGRAHMVAVLAAASYQMKPNLVFDAGFSRGLTSTTTRWQSFAGFTYLLPQRLWPQRKRG